MKISPNLYGRMAGSKFWCFPWFPENSYNAMYLFGCHFDTAEGAEFWISCNRPVFFSSFSLLQGIQNFSSIYYRVASMWHPNYYKLSSSIVQKYSYIKYGLKIQIQYTRNYNLPFVKPTFWRSKMFFQGGFFLKILSLCIVSIQEQFVLKNRLWWHVYIILFYSVKYVPLASVFYVGKLNAILLSLVGWRDFSAPPHGIWEWVQIP